MKKFDNNYLKPSQKQINNLLENYQARRYIDVEKLSISITEEFPEHPFAWKVLAAVLKLTGRLSESLVPSQKSVLLEPKDAEAHNNLGIILQELGKLNEAEEIFKKAISLKPGYATAYNALGFSYADRNVKLDDAKRYIEIALSIEPQNHYIMDSMGWVHFKLGNYDIAYEFINKAFAIQEDPEIAAHLGEVLWKQGKKLEAQSIWQTYLEKFPENAVLIETNSRFTQ